MCKIRAGPERKNMNFICDIFPGKMIIREIRAKTILSVSKIHDYVINPYVGCAHGCRYCYARFIKKYTGHHEAWGDFADVRINAPELLAEEIKKKKRGTVWVSGLCDPYQPVEEEYRITRQCLEILAADGWPVVIQTRSPLVVRDTDIFRKSDLIRVGLSVTTGDDSVRSLFEPEAPSISDRLNALEQLYNEGVSTYAMIAPLLPGAETLSHSLPGKVKSVLTDRMNYHYADRIYINNGLEECRGEDYYRKACNEIAYACHEAGIECRVF